MPELTDWQQPNTVRDDRGAQYHQRFECRLDGFGRSDPRGNRAAHQRDGRAAMDDFWDYSWLKRLSRSNGLTD